MKLRLLAALASIAFLAGVVAHVALAGPPPASWERDNPVPCPLPTPDPGVRPIPLPGVKL